MAKDDTVAITPEPEQSELVDASYSWVAALVLIAFLMVVFFSFGGYTLFVGR